MNPRERKLAIVLGGLVLLAVVAGGYFLVLEPLQAKSALAEKLQTEVDDLQSKAEALHKAEFQLAAAKRRSLPADPKAAPKAGQPAPPQGVSQAKLEYSILMTRLLARAKIPADAITVKEKVTDARGIPVLPNKRPAYTRVVYDVEIRNIDMWEAHDFLTNYYDVDLLHQITAIMIKRDENAGGAKKVADRKDLTLTLTTEAIMLEGAETRRNLIPVPSAFAAVGGWRGFNAIAFNPDPKPARLINPFRTTPLLATPKRDYSLIVRRDMFHGWFPDLPAPAIAKLADVTTQAGTAINPVKLTLTGDIPPGPVKWDVKSDSKLLPPGSLKVDAAKQVLTVNPAEDEVGFGTVNLVATLANGKELKTSFRVAVSPQPPGPVKDEISPFIFLVNTTVRSDGTAVAIIRDRYNPFDYEVRATKEGVRVQKYWYLTATVRKEDGPTTPQLLISDEDVSATKRTLKVIAVDNDGIIVLDITPPPPPGKEKGGQNPKGGPGFNPKGVKDPKSKDVTPPAWGPLAAAVGGPSAVLPPAAAPKLYRWATGTPLQKLTEIPRADAAKILERAEKAGPVEATAVGPISEGPEPITPVVTPVEVAPPPAEVLPGGS